MYEKTFNIRQYVCKLSSSSENLYDNKFDKNKCNQKERKILNLEGGNGVENIAMKNKIWYNNINPKKLAMAKINR